MHAGLLTQFTPRRTVPSNDRNRFRRGTSAKQRADMLPSLQLHLIVNFEFDVFRIANWGYNVQSDGRTMSCHYTTGTFDAMFDNPRARYRLGGDGASAAKLTEWLATAMLSKRSSLLLEQLNATSGGVGATYVRVFLESV
jgi:hypothetical protein